MPSLVLLSSAVAVGAFGLGVYVASVLLTPLVLSRARPHSLYMGSPLPHPSAEVATELCGGCGLTLTREEIEKCSGENCANYLRAAPNAAKE